MSEHEVRVGGSPAFDHEAILAAGKRERWLVFEPFAFFGRQPSNWLIASQGDARTLRPTSDIRVETEIDNRDVEALVALDVDDAWLYASSRTVTSPSSASGRPPR